MTSGLRKDAAQLVDDRGFDVGGRNPAQRAGALALLQHGLADVVAIELALAAGVGRRHGVAGGAEDQALEQGRGLRPGAGGTAARGLGEEQLHLVPELAVDDRRVLARIGDTFVHRLADIDPVAEQLVEEALVGGPTALGGDALGGEGLGERGGRADADEALEDHPHRRGLGRVDHELSLVDPIAERRVAAHPHAAGPGCRELVPDPLADHLALELGEGEQHVEGQPAHRGGGVERLGDADEGDVVPIEHLDQPGEVHERAGEPVDLVDDDDVDAAQFDVGHETLQGRALQRAAGEAAVVVTVGNQQPALGLLAGDVGLAGLALGVEGVEGHVETFLGRLAGVDRAALLEGGPARLHGRTFWLFKPKKVQPFQRVPVIARATAESDLYGRPCQS